MAKEKVRFIVKDGTDNILGSFKSKEATKIFGKLAQGTQVKIFCDEGKDYGEQFLGNMEVRGLPEGPVTPPPVDPNKPPVVNAGQDITVKPGVSVTLDGSATDLDGVIDRVEWRQIPGGPADPIVQLTTDTADMTNVSFVAPDVPAGQSLILEFLIEAFDDKGKSAMDKIKVTITSDTTPPPPTPAGTIWKDKWGNGHARTIKGVAVDPDDDQFEMRAGQDVAGMRELVIDGQGTAKCTGERYRGYVWNEHGKAGSQGGAE
jgi:hypothetical protein